MRKVSVLALAVFAFWTADARAIEIKNVRGTYGPFGATRPANKMLPGDIYMLCFDITDLAIDAKSGLAKYEITLEVFDPKGKQVVKDQSKKGVVVALGGNTVPESVQLLLGVDQAPGKYKAIVTIQDPDTKKSKQVLHELELVAQDFGFIHVSAPAVGLTGQDYMVEYSLVGMTRDANKIPKITVTLTILDAAGKPTLAEPSISKFPEDLPAELRPNVPKQEVARLGS
ncbi:MAG TPA: hypothetical protein VE988_28275, partial [Gemmataceae bacterium]|nr:hypothetical protein [Gemmataceae bacterium]